MFDSLNKLFTWGLGQFKQTMVRYKWKRWRELTKMEGRINTHENEEANGCRCDKIETTLWILSHLTTSAILSVAQINYLLEQGHGFL